MGREICHLEPQLCLSPVRDLNFTIYEALFPKI
jgi:hypothetical protein